MKCLTLIIFLFFNLYLFGQSQFNEYKNLFVTPLNYVVGTTSKPPVIDGLLDDQAWQNAKWTSNFNDIEGETKPKPRFDTRAKMLWDSKFLYIAAELKENHIWANLTTRDQIVFYDNDFEIFINPENNGHCYFEIEVNALNTIFDLFLPKPYRAGGPPLFAWNTPGMQHAVHINGTLNNTSDLDTSWTVEFAIPYEAVTLGNYCKVPKNGEIWRINFSRVEWETEIIDGKYVKKKDNLGKTLPENNWVWSAQGVIDMHRPERWGYLQFSTIEASEKLPSFVLPYSEKQRQYLWYVFYKQFDFATKNKRFAKSLDELGLEKMSVVIDNIQNKLKIIASENHFTVEISDNSNKKIVINSEGLIR